MPTTTKFSLPYPALTDAPNVPQHLQSLATAVEQAMPQPVATGATVTFLTGWTIASEGQTLRRVALGNTGWAIVSWQINIFRATGASTITPTASGNITPDVDICTLPGGYRPPQITPLIWQAVTTAPASGRIGTDGVVSLQEMAPGGSITAGASMRIGGCYLANA